MLRVVPPRTASAEPLRVAVLCSGRAPGLSELLRRGAVESEAAVDRRGGIRYGGERVPPQPYRVVGCVTSEPRCRDADALEQLGVPVLQHGIRSFYSIVKQPLRDHHTRRAYDARTREMLRALRADIVLLCGYLYVVTDVLLEAFPDRILNIHDSDLAVVDGDGLPSYRGLHATREAIFAREPETRSTVHLVTHEVDVGPVVARSWAFPTHPMLASARMAGASDILKAYAYAQREWMMLESWAPLMDAAIRVFAARRLRWAGGRLLVDGRAEGIELTRTAAVGVERPFPVGVERPFPVGVEPAPLPVRVVGGAFPGRALAPETVVPRRVASSGGAR